MVCRNFVGNNWGYNQKILLLMYKVIITPMITYGAVAWSKRRYSELFKRNQTDRSAVNTKITNDIVYCIIFPSLELLLLYLRQKLQKNNVYNHLQHGTIISGIVDTYSEVLIKML